ncbi:FAD/NAD(P)-binding protein [Sphingobacterium oryzagri]|uniref:FAD/NAD(P)-binding protein n=1 Tax=Sphingobacterium oryzagri TaxID=3025669 RepID=A0ABY7WJG3_9SPHI|nr:FAD/NAD(P)-binding protein [Sphingobacterium sp. KACC 22765]WDF69665.1 FAD/NAD(P)-binding protein [Sphingobacterium sp. KACC 22765]
MIWKTEHIDQNARSARYAIQQHISESKASRFGDELVVGIVGGGPKGFYALERLFMEMQSQQLTEPIRIYLFNETPDFASGPNYQVDQADYLLINYCIGNIDAWNREAINPEVKQQLNLTQWIEAHQIAGIKPEPTDYASRAVVGSYLQDQLKGLLASKPACAEVHFIVGKVSTISYEHGFHLQLENQHQTFQVDKLLLATGHCYSNASLLQNEKHLLEMPANYFARAYPVHKLDSIPAQASVGVVGLGLTFIDVALQLTEGRGGKFTDSGEYLPSGKEPRIVACSRTNVPILARGPVYGGNHYQLRPKTIQYFKQLAASTARQKIDFEEEIYPVLQQEAHFAYYSTLLQTSDIAAIKAYTDSLPTSQRFQLENLLFPSYAEYDAESNPVLTYIEANIEQARLGELQSPIMAAAAVWREATNWIADIYNHGGLTGESQRVLDKELWGAFCRTSFGPPVENMQKIIALAKAGVIQFSTEIWASMHYDTETAQFMWTNDQDQQSLSYLIDARIARGKLQQANAPLYSALLANGLIQPHSNERYQPGGPALDTDGRAISAPHIASPPLFFYGSPTEGVLLDNDSLSRKRNDMATPWAKHIVHYLIQTHKEIIHENYNGR